MTLPDPKPDAERRTEDLMPLVYEELRHLARQRYRGEGRTPSLNATGLVHEAYLKLARDADKTWMDRAHFFLAAARTMQCVMVDRARALATDKRRARRDPVPLDEIRLHPPKDVDPVALSEALGELESREPRQAHVVMLRYYIGLTVEETGQLLGIAPATVKRTWTYARAWLLTRLSESEEGKS